MLTVAACSSDPEPSNVSLRDPVSPAGEEGDVVITLHREGGGGALSIPYTTADVTATAGVDYVGSTGTVEWAAGDFKDKSIVVSLMDDVIAEPSETLGITLGEPSNGSVVDRSDLTITIADDDHPGDSFAVTSKGRLMHFARSQPGRFCFAVELTGFVAGEHVIALDTRPKDGTLYGLTDTAKLYTIDPTTGAATLKSALTADATDATSPFTGLAGTAFGKVGRDHVRISYANSRENLREALGRISRFVANARAGRIAAPAG